MAIMSRSRKTAPRKLALDLVTWVLVVAAIAVAGLRIGEFANRRPPSTLEASDTTRVTNYSDYADGHRVGPPNAPVTVVQFGDYRCEFCKAAAPYLRDLPTTYESQVSVVYRQYPYPGASYGASVAAVCAGRQGRFGAMHDALYAQSDSIGLRPWSAFALDAGVSDTLVFNECSQSSLGDDLVVRDTMAAAELGVTGVPTFLINDLLVSGFHGPEVMNELVEEALRRARSSPPSFPRTYRDSAGVRVVESDAPIWDSESAWRVEEAPVVDLTRSGTGDMHFFSLVRDVLRVGEDRLVVADGGSSELRVYDASGRFLRSFGGRGDGPGEFGFIDSLVLLRDGRFVAQDLAPGGRGAEFEVESGWTASFQRPQGVYPLTQPAPSSFIWGMEESWVDRTVGSELQRPPVTLVRLSDDRRSRETIVTVPGDEVLLTPTADAIPLMGRQTHLVPAGDGDIVIGLAEDLSYSKIDGHSGTVSLIARVGSVSLDVSKEELDVERRTRLGPNPSPTVRQIMADLPEPSRKPAYQRLLVDTEGNVWAGEFLGLARWHDSQKWYVWDPSGVWLGIVETPPAFELVRVGSDEVFGFRRDLNDVEHPQVLRLLK